MNEDDIKLFALDASRDYGEKIARHLDIALSRHEEREFDDGEHKSRPLENLRGRDVYVIQSLYADPHHTVNDKLCRLLFFLGAVRDANAARVTAVIPYLCYARKDRKTQPRDPVTTRYVAGMLEAVGTDHVMTMDVHNLAAFHNAFHCTTDHLEARSLFADCLVPQLVDRDVVVVSPDAGGIKRAERFRRLLSDRLNRPVTSAFMEKYRGSGSVSGETLIGDVADRSAVILDDLIGTGTTVGRAVAACHARGAIKILAAASHGLFVGNAREVIDDSRLTQVAVTDTVPPFRLEPQVVHDKLTVIDATGLFAAAIRCMHEGGSITSLMEG